MKKMYKLLICLTAMCFMLSCDIPVWRPNSATVSVVLEDIPAGVGAVSIWCAPNEWKADNVNGNPLYVKAVEDGKVKFELEGYVLSEPLQFQLTPMPSVDTKMGDDWWSYAISGSSQYAKNKNNITCDFIAKGKSNGDCTITINKTMYGASYWENRSFPLYGVNSNRWFNESYNTCFSVK